MDFLTFKKYLKELLILALPILAGNIGQMLINIGDVYVAGHFNTNTLAAISVASAIFMTFIIPGLGFAQQLLQYYQITGAKENLLKNFLGLQLFSLKFLQ